MPEPLPPWVQPSWKSYLLHLEINPCHLTVTRLCYKAEEVTLVLPLAGLGGIQPELTKGTGSVASCYRMLPSRFTLCERLAYYLQLP